MVRNKGKGGKNFKKAKNYETVDKRQIIYKTEGQEYALITKMLGNGRCECKCYDGRTRLGHIRGKMHKRVWICIGDTVLVSLRDYQDDKADIIHKYTSEETKTLISYNEITGNIKIDDEDGINDDNNSNASCEIDFDDI
jgi:translation initiation factor 1A